MNYRTTQMTEENLAGVKNHRLVFMLEEITAEIENSPEHHGPEYTNLLDNRRVITDTIIRRMNG